MLVLSNSENDKRMLTLLKAMRLGLLRVEDLTDNEFSSLVNAIASNEECEKEKNKLFDRCDEEQEFIITYNQFLKKESQTNNRLMVANVFRDLNFDDDFLIKKVSEENNKKHSENDFYKMMGLKTESLDRKGTLSTYSCINFLEETMAANHNAFVFFGKLLETGDMSLLYDSLSGMETFEAASSLVMFAEYGVAPYLLAHPNRKKKIVDLLRRKVKKEFESKHFFLLHILDSMCVQTQFYLGIDNTEVRNKLMDKINDELDNIELLKKNHTELCDVFYLTFMASYLPNRNIIPSFLYTLNGIRAEMSILCGIDEIIQEVSPGENLKTVNMDEIQKSNPIFRETLFALIADKDAFLRNNIERYFNTDESSELEKIAQSEDSYDYSDFEDEDDDFFDIFNTGGF